MKEGKRRDQLLVTHEPGKDLAHVNEMVATASIFNSNAMFGISHANQRYTLGICFLKLNKDNHCQLRNVFHLLEA